MKKLELYSSYSREEIHGTLSPNTKFIKSAGTWGLQGLVRVENSNDFVFMVTAGTVVGEHEFDEGFTEDGVFRWQSQPKNTLKTQKVIDLIRTKSSFKVTLGGCIIKKVNETVILSKE